MHILTFIRGGHYDFNSLTKEFVVQDHCQSDDTGSDDQPFVADVSDTLLVQTACPDRNLRFFNVVL